MVFLGWEFGWFFGRGNIFLKGGDFLGKMGVFEGVFWCVFFGVKWVIFRVFYF